MAKVTDVESRIIKKHILNDKLSNSLNSIRRIMEHIWANDAPRIVQNYTDHGVEHSKRIIGYTENLLQVGKNAKFTENEIYLLLAGVYLHDIGMQCDITNYPKIKEKAEYLGAKFNEKFIEKTANGYSPEGQEEIRKNHHYLSAAWIDYLYQGHDSVLSPLIKSVPYTLVDDLMDVCKFHSKLKINLCLDYLKGDPNSRKKMVASLLRFADELDINSERVNIETVKIYSLNSDNSVHWWLHNCREVHLIENKVLLQVNLNSEDFEVYASFLNEMLITEFQIKNQPILNVLVAQKIPLVIDENSSVVAHERIEKFPPDIKDALNKLINKSNSTSISSHLNCKSSIQVPQIKNFVGRTSELSSLRTLLDKNIVIIEGIAGIGKTYLASRFVEEIKDEYKVYWYEDLSESTSIGSVMRQMALFLNENDKPTLYKSIENIGYDYDYFVNIFKKELINGKFIIFFDNFHKAAEVLNPLMKKLLDIQSSKIILITRIKPTFYNKLDELENRIGYITVDPWDYEATRDMFKCRGLVLSEEDILEEIHIKLHGHPQYLNLFCILALKSRPKELLDKLPAAEKDSYAYLEAEVYNSLEVYEKTLLKIASVYRVPEKIDAFYLTPDIPNVDETLDRLMSKFLVNKVGDEKYSVHEIISDYCLKDVKKRKIIKNYHGGAAKYYELKDKSPESLLEASYHYIKAGDNDKSADIIISNASDFIEKGFWDKIEELLKDAIQTLSKHRHNPQVIRKIGYAHTLIGEFYTERGDLALALDELNKSEKLFMRTRNKDDLYRLNSSFGHTYDNMGELDKAMNCYQKCLDLAKSDEHSKVVAKGNLGSIHFKKGNYKKALELYLECNVYFEECEDRRNVATSYLHIGKCYSSLNNFEGAYLHIKKAIKLFKDMGQKYNLCICYLEYVRVSLSDPNEKENVELIIHCLAKILDIFQKMGHIRGEAEAYSCMALVNNRLKNECLSIEYYHKAIECLDKIDYCNLSTSDKIEIAIILLSLNNFDKAEGIINDAIQSISDSNYLNPLLSLLSVICLLCKGLELQAMELIGTDIKDFFQKNYKFGNFNFLAIYALIEKQKSPKMGLIIDIIAFIQNKTNYPKIRLNHVTVEGKEIQNYADVFHPFIGHLRITKSDKSLKVIVSKLMSTDIEVNIDMDNILGINRNTALMILGYLYKQDYLTVSELSTDILKIGLSQRARSKLVTSNMRS